MQSDLFNCSVCRDPFNSTDHLPKIMPICGKTLCEACLKGIVGKNKMCPLCNKTLPKNSQDSSRYLTNDILVQIIEDRCKNEAGRCMKHDKPGDLACITDRCLICRQCTIEHQGHKVRPVDEVKSEAQDKKNKLRSLLLDLGEQRTDVLEKKTIFRNMGNIKFEAGV